MKYFLKIKIKLSIKIIFLFIFISFHPVTAFAVWDGLPYSPGETTNPECLPSQTDCDVLPSLTSETDPLSIRLNQTTPQTFTAGAVTGTGLLGVTAGVLGLNTSISGINTGDQTTITGNAGTATSLSGGLGGQIPYQSDANTTAMLANGTAGQVLTSAGTTLAPTWTTIEAGGDALVANPLSQFTQTTSLQLKDTISDETGSGTLVFATSPTFVTPDLGTPSAVVLTNATGLPVSGVLAGTFGSGAYTFQGTSATDYPTLGSEFLLESGWTSTNWTGSWATGWTHATGNASVLSNSKVAVLGTKYQISYIVTGRTAGSFVVAFGGQTQVAQTGTNTYAPTATSTAGLTITPASTFDGTIVVSIKAITAVSTPLLNFDDSSLNARFEVRALSTENLFFGTGSGQYATSGIQNTAVGTNALSLNTSGIGNTAVGYGVLKANTVGEYNTGLGLEALFANVSGIENTAFGFRALWSNTTGNSNTAIGRTTLLTNTTGSGNTAIGYKALNNSLSGNNNTAIGDSAGFSNTTGIENIAIGNSALRSNTVGRYNTAIGLDTLRDLNLTSGVGYNTAVGYGTARGIITGTQNTIIGARVIGLSSTLSNNIILADGAGAIRIQIDSAGNVGIGTTAPVDQLQLSGSTATKASGTTWSNPSDMRLKKNVTPFTDGLSVIAQINPIRYTLNGLAGTPEGISDIGIIAQEIKDVVPYTVDAYKSKLHPEDTETTELYSFNASALTFISINAIKELNLKVLNLEENAGISGSASSSVVANAGNGLTNILANRVGTKELCVEKSNGTNVCVTGDQLEYLLSNAGIANTSLEPEPELEPELTPTPELETPIIPELEIPQIEGDQLPAEEVQIPVDVPVEDPVPFLPDAGSTLNKKTFLCYIFGWWCN